MSRTGYVCTFGSKRVGKRALAGQFLLDKLKGKIVLIGKVDKPRVLPVSCFWEFFYILM